MDLKRWMCILLLASVPVAPVFAKADDTAKAKSTAADDTKTTAQPAPADSKDSKAAASSTPAPNPKVNALLDVLVAKGVLAPAEANTIRGAAPDAEVTLLIEALNRKGLLNAADLAAVGTPEAAPAAGPAFVAPSPSAASNAGAVSVSTDMQPQNPQNPHPETEAAGTEPRPRGLPPGVVPAVAAIRTLPIDPPKKDGLVAACLLYTSRCV